MAALQLLRPYPGDCGTSFIAGSFKGDNVCKAHGTVNVQYRAPITLVFLETSSPHLGLGDGKVNSQHLI